MTIVGDVVRAWVLTGTSYNGTMHSPIYGEVVRVNRKTLTIHWLHSCRTQRCDPSDVDLCTGQEAGWAREDAACKHAGAH